MGILYKNNASSEYGIKDVDGAKGIVSGYASTFHIKDSDNETVLPGAFKQTINMWKDRFDATGNSKVKMLRDHDITRLVGIPTELKEDDIGLQYVSKISQKIALGRDTLALIQEGIITEHSFGYYVFQTEKDEKDETNTFLKELGLKEISYVAYGANIMTPIISAKSENSIEDKESTLEYINRVKSFIKNGKLDSDEMIDLISIFAEQLENKFESLYNLEQVKSEQPTESATERIEINTTEAEPEAHFDPKESEEQSSEEEFVEDAKSSKEEKMEEFINIISKSVKDNIEEKFNQIYKELEHKDAQEFWSLDSYLGENNHGRSN